jgi:hypothetical protein
MPPDDAWLDEVTAAAGPPFLRMGTRASPGGWLTSRPHDAALLAEKRRVLAAHHDAAVAALPGSERAAAAVLRAVRAATARAGTAGAGTTGAGTADAGTGGLHPLDAAARLVAEDLCLLLPAGGGGWVLAAGSVCFPSHWRLRDKLGLPLAAVHGPVPRYADELAARVDRFVDRLAPGRPVWRRNWTVHASPALFAPDAPQPPSPPVTTADAGERLWLRSERQALARLRAHDDDGDGGGGIDAVVFAIRTDQVPLARLAARPRLARALADAAAAWPPELVAYRGGEAVRGPLVAWLRATAGGRPTGGASVA